MQRYTFKNATIKRAFWGVITGIILVLSVIAVVFSFLPKADSTVDALSSSTTYYKNGSSFYTLTSSVQHYQCTRSRHTGANDYTTSSVSGTCYTTSGYYYDCGSCGGTGSKTTTSNCSSCGGTGSKTTTGSCGTCGGDGEVITGYGTHSVAPGPANFRCTKCGATASNATGLTGGSCSAKPQYGSCGSCGGSGSKTTTTSCGSCGGDGKVSSSTSCTSCGGDGEKYSSGSSYGHSISPSYVLYTYKNIDTNATATSQSAYSTATGYTVTYNSNGGSGSMSTQYFLHGHSQALTSNGFTRTNYSFLGWSTSSTATTATYTNGQAVTSVTTSTSVTLYAVWKLDAATVSFNANGGTACSDMSIIIGATYGTLPTTTRTGYTFGGWFASSALSGSAVTNSTTVSASHTLYAKWTANTYTVTLDRQSGTGGTASVTATYDSAMPAATAPTRTGYTFGGYYSSQNGGGTQYYTNTMSSAKNWTVAGNTTLYAKWTANTYTVTLDRQNGTGGSASVTATYDSDMPAATAPTRTGYAFAGYYSGTNGGGTQYYTAAMVSCRTWNVASNTTLYAKWLANTYTVKYNANGGSGTMADSTHTYDTAKALTANAFLRAGYTFKGWSTSNTATTATYTDGQSVTNLATSGTVNLYAVWEQIIRTITVTSSDDAYGTVRGAGSYAWGTEVQLIALCKQDYVFLYWAEIDGNGAEITIFADNPLTITVTEDKSYKAVFGKTSEGISVAATLGGLAYIVGDDFASLGDNDMVTFSAKLALEGYKFSHWEDKRGNNLGTQMTLSVKKSVVKDNVITAVFVPA